MKKSLVIFKENVSHHISLSIYFIRTEKVLISQNDGNKNWCITMMLENIFFFFLQGSIYEINTMNINFSYIKISSRLVERGRNLFGYAVGFLLCYNDCVSFWIKRMIELWKKDTYLEVCVCVRVWTKYNF